MRVTPLQPSLTAVEVRTRQDTDPTLEGEMLRAAKRSQEALTPVGVELIEAADGRPAGDSAGRSTGTLVDTYA